MDLLRDQIRSDQMLSRVRLFVTPWIAACQPSLSITSSQSSLKLESVMPSSYLIPCHPLLLLPPIPPSMRVFSNESTLHMRWPKYQSFSFSIIPSKEIPGLISFRMDWWWYPCIKAFRQQSWAVKESPKLWWSLVLVTEQITFHGLLLSGSSKETKEPVYSVCVCVWLDQEI